MASEPICRCKLRLKAVRTQVQRRYDPDAGERHDVKLYDLEFTAVSKGDDPDDENTKFWEATPVGDFHFKTVRREVAERFDLNEEYYCDFILASQE